MQLDAGANTITKVGYINATVYIASLSRFCSISDSVSLSRSVCGHPHASHNSIKHCPEPEPSGEVEEAEAEAEEWSLKQKGQTGQRGKGAKRDRGGEGAKDKRAKLKPSNGSSQRYNRNAVTTCDRRATKRREEGRERREERKSSRQIRRINKALGLTVQASKRAQGDCVTGLLYSTGMPDWTAVPGPAACSLLRLLLLLQLLLPAPAVIGAKK